LIRDDNSEEEKQREEIAIRNREILLSWNLQ